LPLQSVRPFWMMEYVSKHNKRKDYEESFAKYERELKVPYYLVFYPDAQELTLFKHGGKKYRVVKPNEHGRYPIPELELEMALLDGWVRFWFRGELLPLPDGLQRKLDEVRQQLDEARRQLAEARRRAEAAEQESARLRAELERLRKR